MTQITLFLRDIEVARRYDISRPTIWRWVKQGQFPQPTKLSCGASRWRVADLEQWESSKNSREAK